MRGTIGPDEPEARARDPMPKRYRFVPKGNVYITKHCRKRTYEADKTLFVVVDKRDNKPLGLHCPAHIYHAVMREHAATAAQRAEAVQKREATISENFEEAILKHFPNIPKTEVSQIPKHSLKKHSRRVGRTGTVALHDRVKLAVRAHIRHLHTDYNQLLKQGVGRPAARDKILARLNEVARLRGGRPLKLAAPTGAAAKERQANKKKVAPTPRGKSGASGAAKKAVINGPGEDVEVRDDVFVKDEDEDTSDFDSD